MISSIQAQAGQNLVKSAYNMQYEKKESFTMAESSVILEIGNIKNESLVYQKPDTSALGQIDMDSIDKLWAQVEKNTDSLKRLVEKVLVRQRRAYNISIKFAKSENTEEVNVVEKYSKNTTIDIDDKTIAAANALIAEDGELGVEKTANRIVDFAKALSGGDKSKIEALKNAVLEGFKEAEKVLGKLPEISQKTYDRVLELFDEWENE
jgi:hypothetical protein